MLQEQIVVEVEKRLTTGKNAANRLRAQDQIPAVLYGGGKEMETWSLQVPRKTLATLLNKGLHSNAIFKLNLKGTSQTRHVMIRDLTLDPVSRKMLHVDFVRVLLDRKLRVKSEIAIEGVPSGVKNAGGILNIVTHEILIECLPADIPESVKVDVSAMEMHDSLRVSDLKLGDRIKVLENADRVIAHVGVPKAEEVAAPAAAEVVGVEGAAVVAVEPEVIKKGKKEEEGAEPVAAVKAAVPAKAEGKAEKKEKK
ncbi:MAG TPA: 50S ribosomal protein L25 [Thermoanaerobaculia bacterium]|nr:50S ribosomal protein L25 [Thermoanaerobaculia bacterium]